AVHGDVVLEQAPVRDAARDDRERELLGGHVELEEMILARVVRPPDRVEARAGPAAGQVGELAERAPASRVRGYRRSGRRLDRREWLESEVRGQIHDSPWDQEAADRSICIPKWRSVPPSQVKAAGAVPGCRPTPRRIWPYLLVPAAERRAAP